MCRVILQLFGVRVLKFSLTIMAFEDRVTVCISVCASGTSVCLWVSTGTPTIFIKPFGISGAFHPSPAENQPNSGI